MAREEPELIRRAIWLETMLNQRRRKLGKDPVFLHASAKPLAEALKGEMEEGKELETDFCESGYCMV